MRQFTVRARMIDRKRKLVRQHLGNLVDGNVIFGGELPHGVVAEYLPQLIGRDGQVVTGADPGFHLLAKSGLLQLGDDRIQSALTAGAQDFAQHRRKDGSAKLAEDGLERRRIFQ